MDGTGARLSCSDDAIAAAVLGLAQILDPPGKLAVAGRVDRPSKAGQKRPHFTHAFTARHLRPVPVRRSLTSTTPGM